MAGKDYKVFISSDGTSGGTKTEVEFQGDMTVNLGRPLSRTNYKNGSKTAQGNDGFSASFQMGIDEPLPAGEVLVWNAHDNGGDAYIWIESSVSGGQSFEGPMKISVQSIEMPTTGETVTQVELSEDGNVVRSTVP